MIDPDFWENRKVLITGHTGFKGSWLGLWLSKMGAQVTGYSLNPTTTPSMYELLNIANRLHYSVIGDVRDPQAFTEALHASGPDIVIHMAAQSLVRESYLNPATTYATNVMGTVNMLEAVRSNANVKVVLNVTTDKCYENKEWLWGYREQDPLGGYDPYSSSKGCAELVSAAYRNSFLKEKGIALATARAGNVIGGGDWAKERIIPDAIRSFLSKDPLTIRNPKAIRPWQHVLEPLAGYIMLCQRLFHDPAQFAESWNFGPFEDDAECVSSLVDRIVEIWGEGAHWQLDQKANPHEAGYLRLDCSKARTLLKWKPLWRLPRALNETVEWYKAYYRNADIIDFTLNQIDIYQKEHLAS